MIRNFKDYVIKEENIDKLIFDIKNESYFLTIFLIIKDLGFLSADEKNIINSNYISLKIQEFKELIKKVNDDNKINNALKMGVKEAINDCKKVIATNDYYKEIINLL